MSGFATWFQLIYLAGALLFFGAVALVTRARGRRIAGALTSVTVFTLLSAPIDRLGAWAQWWSYPSCANPPHPPLLVYIGQALIFVGGVALAGWRAQRRWGASGLVVLSLAICGAGLARDMTVAAVAPTLIKLGPRSGAELADLGAWAVVVAVALGVTRLVAGAAANDVPRR